MKGLKLIYFLVPAVSFILTGCVVRTYEATRDRVDQSLAGNRGYLKGSVPETQVPKERKTTRNIRVVELEIHPPIRFEKMPKTKIAESKPIMKQATEDREISGNQGYLTRSISPLIEETATYNFQKYTVQKNDTLQKISQKFYGTTKKWSKIYDANKNTMKGPNKIYPGQVINIPALESVRRELKEPAENLK